MTLKTLIPAHLFLILAHTSFGWSGDWSSFALSLSGESDGVRARAVADLRAVPNLNEVLRKEIFGPKRALALDVITALKLRSLLSDLLRLAPVDDTGATPLAIASLVDTHNRTQIVRIYRELFACRGPCPFFPVYQIVALETLERLGEVLPLTDVKSLLRSRSYEVRIAALNYVRTFLRKKYWVYLPLVKMALQSNPTQLRLQARYLLKELKVQSFDRDLIKAGESPFILRESSRALQSHDLRIAFGYKDARPARFVGDRYERVYLLEQLIKPCGAKSIDQYVCGFERDLWDGDLLVKKVMGSLSQPTQLFYLRLTSASVSPDDIDNRKNPYQKIMSQSSQDNWINGLTAADAVYYIGHSRDGGGPDFAPPRLTQANHVDYAWYQRVRPGLTGMLSVLGKKEPQKTGHPKVLGILSCVSSKLFMKQIVEVSGETELVTTDALLYYTDALNMTVNSLSKFIFKTLAASARRTRT